MFRQRLILHNLTLKLKYFLQSTQHSCLLFVFLHSFRNYTDSSEFLTIITNNYNIIWFT